MHGATRSGTPSSRLKRFRKCACSLGGAVMQCFSLNETYAAEESMWMECVLRAAALKRAWSTFWLTVPSRA
ncbi:UNVERIFIED_CONTAM: hypothetical protein Sradi_1495200 [Sesamum radiatum]|uniref:Uncharacterized protein n=1 Tax=Sesamum radiatum TaxID=300843 RepID=A0AAW2U9C3_SESRA